MNVEVLGGTKQPAKRTCISDVKLRRKPVVDAKWFRRLGIRGDGGNVSQWRDSQREGKGRRRGVQHAQPEAVIPWFNEPTEKRDELNQCEFDAGSNPVRSIFFNQWSLGMEKTIYHGRYVASSSGAISNAETGRVLRGGRTSKGYLSVCLYDGSSPKRPKSFMIHRLIAEAFLGDGDGRQVNHKNGDKTDNRLENLEWVTLQENIDHSRQVLGKTQHGETNSRCKIPADVVVQIRKRDRTARSWAEELGCNTDYIHQIRCGSSRLQG